MRNTKKQFFQRGVAALFALLLTAFILAIVLTISAIFIPKLRNASETKNSVTAIYAAESIVEWCLYKNRVEDIAQPTMGAGILYTITPADCSSSPIKSTGTYSGVTRAFELTF